MNNVYEAAVQRNMMAMARKNGALTGELRNVRTTLKHLLPMLELAASDWRARELQELIDRIDRELAAQVFP